MRLLLLLVFFYSFINAGTIKRELYLDILLSQNNQEFKSYRSFDLENDLFKTATVKLNINKKILEDRTYYVKTTCDVNKLIYSNIAYEVNFDTIIFKLDKNTPSSINLEFEYEEPKNLNFRLFTLNEFEYKNIVKYEGVLFGIAYGIIFCAFLYNFVIFLYTLQRSFFYYSLMQISLLFVLFYITMLSNQTFISDIQQIIIDFFETLCMLLTILFSKEILNTRKSMKQMNKLLNFLVYIHVVDLIAIFIFKESILYGFMPRSVIVFILVFSGVIALINGQKTAIFYFLGWMVLFISLFISEYELIGIDMLYIVHIGFPLESLILSFALGYKLKQTVDEKKEKEKILVHQSKLASMGEMINNIAHQWRQPLSHLSFINMDLQMAQEDNDLKEKYLLDKLNESNNQIDFMSATIDNFKNFYQPRKEKEFFYVSAAIQSAIDIIKPSLDFSNININFRIEEDKKIKAYENEYSQVILNFLTNAKDVLLSRKIENPKIEVKLELENNRTVLSVNDNAGGIKNEIIDKIFEPYFTTKDKSSGIGLYMSKTIVESHLKGNINVKNNSNGACFVVEV
ncbi:sensor histidine kinase [Poseidonibacter lekithochrous]|uniref:sensor histidine kinase n=1 Tax=Poseidonibacter lekithochrous TaxID=1904463 RepID=UPI000D3BAD75|nr:sensor histidine kinase [Poseidonibacter lekithochrous]